VKFETRVAQLWLVSCIYTHFVFQQTVQGGWDNWGKEEDAITRQIREYRTSLAEARQKQSEEEAPETSNDYFQVRLLFLIPSSIFIDFLWI
jgi:hypothetical protein